MIKNKTWTLTPTHTLTPSPPNKRGKCAECDLEKDIWIISDNPFNIMHFCWFCSIEKVYKLETGDYPVENKQQIVKEIRAMFTLRSIQ